MFTSFNDLSFPITVKSTDLLGMLLLRLCQDIVRLKAEVAELLLPSVIVDLAGRKDMDVDLHKLISLQVTFFGPFCRFPLCIELLFY